MGVSTSKESPTKVMRRKAKNARYIKLLLIGAGDSGKTTVFKQLRNSKGAPFSEEERVVHGNGLLLNVLQGILELIKFCEDHSVSLSQYSKQCLIIKGTQSLNNSSGQLDLNLNLTTETVESLLTLWESNEIKSIYIDALRDGQYEIQDNYSDLVEKLNDFPQWGGSGWLPNDDDCMLWRNPTSGVNSETFEQRKNLFVKLIDVGGQRNERNKWLHVFEGVNGLIFVCSMSEYDQTLFEDHSVNRTLESLSIFKTLAENELFADAAFIMFFNKYDLFQHKYQNIGIPLNVSGLFPNAPLVEQDDIECSRAKAWFYNKFVGSLNGAARKRHYFQHYTTALDKGQLEEVIKECAAHILTQGFGNYGLG